MDNSWLFNDPASQLDLDDPETLETIFQAMDSGFAELNENPNAFFSNNELSSAFPSVPEVPEPLNQRAGNFKTYPRVSSGIFGNGLSASSSFTVDDDDLFVPNDFSEDAEISPALFTDSEPQEVEEVEGAQGLLALAFTNTENPAIWAPTGTDAALPTIPALPDIGPTGFDDLFGPTLAPAPAPAPAVAPAPVRARSNNVHSNRTQSGTIQPGAIQLGTGQLGTAQVGTGQLSTGQLGTAQQNTAQPNNATVPSTTRQIGQFPITSELNPYNWTQGTGLLLPNNMDPQERAQKLAIIRASAVLLNPVPTAHAALQELQRRVTGKGDKHGKKRSSTSKTATKKRNTMPSKRVRRATHPSPTRKILPATAKSTVQVANTTTPSLPPSHQVQLGAQPNNRVHSQSPSPFVVETGSSRNTMPALFPRELPSQQSPPPRRRSNPIPSTNRQIGHIPGTVTDALPTATRPGPMQPTLRIVPTFPRETPDGEALFVPSGRILCLMYRGYSKMKVFVQHEVGSRTIQCNDDIIIAILPGRILFARIPGFTANDNALENTEEATKHIKWAIGEERVPLHLYLLSPMDAQGNPAYCVASASGNTTTTTKTTTTGPESNINNDNTTTIGGQSQRARAAAVRHHMLKFAQQGVENANFYYRAYNNVVERPEEHAGKRYFVCVGPFAKKAEGEAGRPQVFVVDSAGKGIVRDAVTETLAAEYQEERAAAPVLEA